MANERQQFPGAGPKVGDTVGRAVSQSDERYQQGGHPVGPVHEHIRNLAVGIREEARAALADAKNLSGRIPGGTDGDLARGLVARL
ncbi:MAG TPA: hypothetical protein VLA89_05550, partial [Gemmatimonadales bacterium]|nr:hypothetical protein [Gemmatimonadales bacterium]